MLQAYYLTFLKQRASLREISIISTATCRWLTLFVCALVSIALITIAMLIHLVVLIFNTLIFLFYLPNYCSVADELAWPSNSLVRDPNFMGNDHVLVMQSVGWSGYLCGFLLYYWLVNVWPHQFCALKYIILAICPHSRKKKMESRAS